MTWKVGQTVFVRWNYRRRGEHVAIEKVGRKWATLKGGHRVDMALGTLEGETYASSGRVYESAETGEAERRHRALVSKVHQKIGHSGLSRLTPEQLRQLATWVGLVDAADTPGEGK